MDEIGRRPIRDAWRLRWNAWWQRVVEPRWEKVRWTWRDYKFRVYVVCVLLAAWVVLRAIWTGLDPISAFRSDSALELEMNVVFLPIQSVGVRTFKNYEQFVKDERHIGCTPVPLEQLRYGRTGLVRDDTHHSLKNLFDVNHHLFETTNLHAVMPTIYDLSKARSRVRARHPTACVMSLLLKWSVPYPSAETPGFTESTGILDMVNPVEVDVDAQELATLPADARDVVEGKIKDLLFVNQPIVSIESKSYIKVRYRTLDGDAHELILTGRDAHFARISLKLLSFGQPASVFARKQAEAKTNPAGNKEAPSTMETLEQSETREPESVEEDDDDDEDDEEPAPPPPRRGAKAVRSKPKTKYGFSHETEL